MPNDITTHVDPIVFWQSAFGGCDLSRHDYLHLIACPDCTALADQIGAARNNIEQALHGLQHSIKRA
jgi:hypothetical protein